MLEERYLDLVVLPDCLTGGSDCLRSGGEGKKRGGRPEDEDC